MHKLRRKIMSEAQKSSKVAIQKMEDDLPPPPADLNALPVPPPKQAFSKFYQQRQVNELKRLYRHMHPELRKNLEEAVTEDLAEMLNTEDPNAQVQSMRWIFENWALDSIGDHQATKKLTEEEIIPSGDVKSTSLRFESQSINGYNLSTSAKLSETDLARGDVRTARWLFETQPLDTLNKLYSDETEVQEAVLKEPVQGGDVKGAKQLFEAQSLDAIGRCSSVEEKSILQLKSEIQELKGDVKKTVRLFQTEPLCAIRDKSGTIHEIKSVCREEIQTNAVRTARWLFETQPLDTINKDTSKVQIIRGISLEEIGRPDVSGARWIFETQPLDAIREITVEEQDFQASTDFVTGADVTKQRLLFETQTLDSLKGEASESVVVKEKVIGGDVKSTLWLFETQPMETLKDNFEVGRLKKVELSAEEKGDVKQRKHVFETCPLGSISKAFEEEIPATSMEEVVKGDVKSFKTLFETLPLDSIKQADAEPATKEEEEKIPAGNVKANQILFETTPLYAIKDSFGNFHEVTSVSREQIISGDVKNYKWMFETRPLDQFDESIKKVDIIRGITKQEVVAGDVRTAKWLFETQPMDVIHLQATEGEKHPSVKREISQKGDVKTCRWLFETQPMHTLYEKAERKQEEDGSVPQADVKSYTWMFETQPLDSLKGQEEQYLQVSKAYSQEELQGVDVKTVRHLFETEHLGSSTASEADRKKTMRYSSRVEFQSGEVSRVKEFFEAKPLDTATKPKSQKDAGTIEAGSVHKFTWLFENYPMDTLKDNSEGIQEIPPEKDAKGGEVGGKRTMKETLETLCTCQAIQHDGILIEANDMESVKMVKYQLSSPGAPEILKEEIVGGHLQRIMLQLLHRTNVEAQSTLVEEDREGKIKVSPLQLLDQSEAVKGKEDLSGDVAKALQGLLSQDASIKKGMVLQETKSGSLKMTLYSLLFHSREDNEKGNVQLFASCIEKGDLSYLKNLQQESEIQSLISSQAEEEGADESGPRVVQGANIHVLTNKEQMEKVVPGGEPGAMEGRAEVDGKQPSVVPGKASQTQTEEKALGTDLQAAMQSLRLATAEAKNIQHHVQSKFQRNREEVHTACRQQTVSSQGTTTLQSTVHQQDSSSTKKESSSTAT
uniref:Uncharacterized protein n=1 Tax=Geospiza parvula TaxID=87175 RepID=A0A8U8CKR6_GEOPR